MTEPLEPEDQPTEDAQEDAQEDATAPTPKRRRGHRKPLHVVTGSTGGSHAVEEESERAASARERYLALGRDYRSLEKLAGLIRDEQFASALALSQVATPGSGIKPPKVQTKATILRRLKEWSRIWDWPRLAREHDRAKDLEEGRRRDSAMLGMNDERAKLMGAMLQGTLSRASHLMAMDTQVEIDWQERWTTYRAVLTKAREDQDWDRVLSLEPPPTPRMYLNGRSLIEYINLALDEERLARMAGAEGLASRGEQTLAPMVLVHTKDAPPVMPSDPLEAQFAGVTGGPLPTGMTPPPSMTPMPLPPRDLGDPPPPPRSPSASTGQGPHVSPPHIRGLASFPPDLDEEYDQPDDTPDWDEPDEGED